MEQQRRGRQKPSYKGNHPRKAYDGDAGVTTAMPLPQALAGQGGDQKTIALADL